MIGKRFVKSFALRVGILLLMICYLCNYCSKPIPLDGRYDGPIIDTVKIESVTEKAGNGLAPIIDHLNNAISDIIHFFVFGFAGKDSDVAGTFK